MRSQPGTTANQEGTVTLLSISPLEEDHAALHTIISDTKWMLLRAPDLPMARTIFQNHPVSVVVCEKDLTPGTWTGVLDHLGGLRQKPSLIVTSRLADEHLWAEALNLGAWDVLAKPFERNEVLRSVKGAWLHWHDLLPGKDSRTVGIAS